MTTPVETYQAQTEALAVSTVAAALAAYAASLDGEMPTPDAVLLIAALVNRANAAAVTLADAFVSAHVEQVTGVAAPAVGVVPVDATERLVAAVQVILVEAEPKGVRRVDTPDTPVEPAPDRVAPRIERLARAEPLQTAQAAVIEVITEQPQVIGWRRAMDADPCELCRWWWSGGRIYKPTTVFRTHPNCNCQPEPVLATEKKERTA